MMEDVSQVIPNKLYVMVIPMNISYCSAGIQYTRIAPENKSNSIKLHLSCLYTVIYPYVTFFSLRKSNIRRKFGDVSESGRFDPLCPWKFDGKLILPERVKNAMR